MRRVFSMLLVLVMVLSLVSAVSLVSFADGTAGTVVVFAQTDYQNAGVETNGNTYGRKALTFTAAKLVTETAGYLGKYSNWDKPTDYGLTVRDGRVYNWSWDSAFFVEPDGSKYPAPLSVASSGLRNIKNVTRYNSSGTAVTGDATSHVANNFYGAAGDAATKPVASVDGVLNESTGWYTSGYSNIHIHTTDGSETGSIGGSVLALVYYNGIAQFVADSHAYGGAGKASGTGWASGKNYKWTLTADEICDHMPAISGKNADGTDYTGTVYTKEDLAAVEWNLTMNCTGLVCADTSCPNNNVTRMTKAMEGKSFYFGVDNVIWTANAEICDNTVSVTGGSADVDIVVNPTANAEKFETVKYENLADGAAFKANDYFDPAITITPENGKIVSSASYNGQVLELQYNEETGSYTTSINASSVAQNGKLEIGVGNDAAVIPTYAISVEYDSALGSVAVNGNNVANGGSLQFAEGTELTVAVTPAENCMVTGVTANGSAVSIEAAGGSFKYTLNQATSLKVTFEKDAAAEDANNELSSEEIQAENYASVVMSTTSVYAGRTPPSTMSAYVNVDGPYTHAHYLSKIETFKIPNKELITSIEYNQYDTLSQQFKNGNMYHFATLSGFPFSEYENGTYTQGTEGQDAAYTAMNTYVSQYWGKTKTTGDFILAGAILKSDADAKKPVVLNSDFMSAFKSSASEYMTMHTGKLTSMYLYHNIQNKIHSVKVVYGKSETLAYLKKAADAAALKAALAELKDKGIYSNSNYETLGDVQKTTVIESLYPNLANCSSWSAFEKSIVSAMEDTVEMYTVTAEYDNTQGAVTIDGAAFENGASVKSAEGVKAVINITPAEGFAIGTVTLDGKSVSVDPDGGNIEFTFTQNSVLKVEFMAAVDGQVLVKKYDFESGKETFGDSGSLGTDADGNHYFARVITPIGMSTGSGNTYNASGSRGTATSVSLPYLDGESYSLMWKAAFSKNGVREDVSRGTTGVIGMSGGQFITADNAARSQWYGNGATTDGDNVGTVSSWNADIGWRQYGYTRIDYRLWNGTDLATVGAVKSANLNSFFAEWTVHNKLGPIVAQHKAYVGKGYTYSAAKNYKFTIEASDIYGDEAKVDASGNKYLAKTADEIAALPDAERYYDKEVEKDGVKTTEKTEYLPLIKEWNMGMDCSALASEKRAAAFAEAVKDLKLEFIIDDIEWYADAKLYTIPVTIEGNATVTAVANSYTNEVQTAANGKTIEGNDFYDLVLTIDTGSENEFITSVTYGTRDVDFEGSSKATITIPANEVTSKALLIKTESITEKTPQVTNVKVSGESKVGATLSVAYSYSGTVADASTVRWQKQINKIWTDIEGAEGKTYVVRPEDENFNIRAVVTAKNAEGYIWKDVKSTLVYIGELAIFVSPDGDDENGDGSIDKPYKTPEKARDVMRALIEAEEVPAQDVYIYFRGGEYAVDSTFTITSKDSAPEGSTIIYKAYNNEEVIFHGATQISSNKISKVTAEDKDKFGNKIFDRITDKQVQNNLYKIDLGEYEGEIPELPDHGQYVGTFYPNEVYVNGELLGRSRWPNDEDYTAMFKAVKTSGFVDSKTEAVCTVEYPDENDETASWNAEAAADDMMVTGHTNSHWWNGSWNVESIDVENKNFKAIFTRSTEGTYSEPEAGYPFYFWNFLEGIDLPGESYIDRENKVAYFYASTPITGNDDVKLTTRTDNYLWSVDGASGIVIEDIDFMYSRGWLLNVSGSDITVRDCNISHTSSRAAALSGTDIVFENNMVTDTGWGGISVKGGNASTLTSGNNVIRNNVFTHNSRVSHNYSWALQDNGVGLQIVNNEFGYNDHELIAVNGINTYIADNYIHDACRMSGDMGAVYWGRQVQQLGIVIDHNYFERSSNPYIGGWSQSIFADDYCYGAQVTNNIFYRGTLPEWNGGSTNWSYVIKTNGGQHFDVRNNIFVDAPTAAHFQNNQKTYTMQTTFLTYNMKSYWDTIKKYNNNPAWKEYYKGTNWESFFEYFSDEAKAEYDEIMATKTGTEQTDALEAWGIKYGADNTNIFQNNVSVNLSKNTTNNGNETTKNNYLSKDEKIFKDYDALNFELTDEGLAKVRTQAPDFQPVSMEGIGQSGTAGGSVAPSISAAYLSGALRVGGTVRAYYTYNDADGNPEGAHKYQWYSSSKENGTYELIRGEGDSNIIIDDVLAGKYIKCVITPKDSTWNYGDAVETAPVLVSADAAGADKTELFELIDKAAELVNNAKVGTDNGMWAQEDVDALKAAIAEVSVVSNDPAAYQYQVNAAVKTLSNAIDAFNAAVISTLEFFNLGAILGDTENWIVERGEGPVFNEEGEMRISGKSGTTYIGEQYLNKIFSFKLKFETPEGEETTALNLPWSGAEEKASHRLNGPISFRLKNQKGDIWAGGNTGYLFWVKNDTLESQEWTPTQTVNSFANNVFTEYNKFYDVSVGVYDTEDGVNWVLYVDGELVVEYEYGPSMQGVSGYLGFTNSNEGNATYVIAASDVDTTELEAAIADAESFLESAVTGSSYGEYPADVISALKEKVAEAKALAADDAAVQIPVDKAALSLKNAVFNAKGSAASSATVSSSEAFDINYDIAKADLEVKNNAKVTLTFDKDEFTPAVTTKTETAIGTVTMEIPVGSTLSGEGWNETLTVPYLASAPTGNFNGGDLISTIDLGTNVPVDSDNLVRIVFPGMGANNVKVAYKNARGGYTVVTSRVREDSFEAAEAAIGSKDAVKYYTGEGDLVVYTKVLSEFVTYTSAVEDTGSDDEYYGGSSSGGSSASKPSAGSSGGFYTGTTVTPGVNTNTEFVFADMTNHWAKNDVMNMYHAGIVSGVTAVTFEPDRNITRAEFATLIVKALKLDAVVSDDFSDVSADDWFAPYVGAAAKAGIIVGSDGLFRPNDNITREEMAVIIMKAYAYQGKTGGTGAADNFSDKAQISAWAYAYVDAAASAGLISGMGDGSFAPKANATRAQSASLVNRILK